MARECRIALHRRQFAKLPTLIEAAKKPQVKGE
jgi:hypothetical protein